MKIAFLTMQKDEKSLLALFIKYHSRFSGFSSIFILDNGSQDSETLEVLKEAQRWGVNIITRFASSDDFEKKGTRIIEVVNELRLKDGYDFLFPMDCDELLSIELNGTISLDPFEIKMHLGALEDNGEGFRIRKGFNNKALSCDCFQVNEANKVFFSKKSSFKKLDSGFHGRGLNHLSQCELGYLHLHNKPFNEVLRSSRQKLKARINTFTSESFVKLTQRKGGKGVHLAKYFLMSANEYYNHKSTRPAISAPLSKLAKEIGAEAFLEEFTDKSHDSSPNIFWLKCPTNHHIVEDHVWEQLGSSKGSKVIIFAFSDSIQGCPNGNQAFNSAHGFGWIAEKSMSHDINSLHMVVTIDPLPLKTKSSIFGIELPAGDYRIAAVVGNTYFNHDLVGNPVSYELNASKSSGIDHKHRFECWTKHLGGVLHAAFKSGEDSTALKLLSFEYLS